MNPNQVRTTSVPTRKGILQLWQFLVYLLEERKMHSIIQWTEYVHNEFKLIDPEEVARLWGLQKNRQTMNYDKLSRSLRYYYEKGIMQKVSGERYVYKFTCNIKNISFETKLNQIKVYETCTTSGGDSLKARKIVDKIFTSTSDQRSSLKRQFCDSSSEPSLKQKTKTFKKTKYSSLDQSMIQYDFDSFYNNSAYSTPSTAYTINSHLPSTQKSTQNTSTPNYYSSTIAKNSYQASPSSSISSHNSLSDTSFNLHCQYHLIHNLNSQYSSNNNNNNDYSSLNNSSNYLTSTSDYYTQYYGQTPIYHYNHDNSTTVSNQNYKQTESFFY